MVNATVKGANFERDVAAWLSDWFAPARRVWRGQSGEDIACAGPCSFEVKAHTERINLAGWIAQAKRQCGARMPVVILKRRGKSAVDDAYVIMEGRTFRTLVDLAREGWPIPPPDRPDTRAVQTTA